MCKYLLANENSSYEYIDHLFSALEMSRIYDWGHLSIVCGCLVCPQIIFHHLYHLSALIRYFALHTYYNLGEVSLYCIF